MTENLLLYISEGNMKPSKEHVQSPCIEICVLNGEKICLGCFRTLGEISQWQQMEDKMQREVLQKAESRRKSSDEKGDSDV